MRAIVITASDTGYSGEREDISGKVAKDLLEANGYEVVQMILLPDDRTLLADAMRQICDQNQAELVVTTGGTGLSMRDCTPEATMDILERVVPGISEAMRMYSMTFTKRAMLSRGVSGIRNQTLVVNLPGSPKAVAECLTYIIEQLTHGIEILTGTATNCARK